MSAARPAAARRAVYAGPGFGGWWRGHARALSDALHRVRAAPLAATATLAVFALALLLPLLLALFLGNAMRFADSLGSAREISVFLDHEAGRAEAESLASKISARDDVAGVTLRTPDEGLAEFKQTSDLADALELLDGNPLPFVLLVEPAGEARTQPAELAAALESEAGVESVQYDAAWRARLDAWLGVGQRIALLLGLLLCAGALLVVGNTVRLDLAARRDEIALLQLLGADAADIRRPMLHFGVVLGLLAGLLALLGAAIAGIALQGPLDALLATYDDGFALVGPGFRESAIVIAVAALLGWLGARVAAGHYLRTSSPAPA